MNRGRVVALVIESGFQRTKYLQTIGGASGFVLNARQEAKLRHVVDRDSPGGKSDHPIAPPSRQLLIDAFPRHADEGGQFLLRQADVDLDAIRYRLAEPL